MKKYLLVLAAFMTISISVSSSNAAEPKGGAMKIGVVDVDKVVKEIPEAVQADQAMRDLQKSSQDTLANMQNELMKKAEAYQKQRSMMTADQQKKEEDAIKAAESELYRFKESKLAEINEKRDMFLAPIRKKITESIEAVSKDEGLSFVFDKGNGSLLFSEDKYDVTFKVIDRIKRGSK
jgi:outer membrane protein